jgi:hypothetical protein
MSVSSYLRENARRFNAADHASVPKVLASILPFLPRRIPTTAAPVASEPGVARAHRHRPMLVLPRGVIAGGIGRAKVRAFD